MKRSGSKKATGTHRLFAVGGGETEGFRDQSRRFADAWGSMGAHSELRVVPATTHFTVLACAASAVNPLRMSVTPAASQTRVFAGTGITPKAPGSVAPRLQDHSSR